MDQVHIYFDPYGVIESNVTKTGSFDDAVKFTHGDVASIFREARGQIRDYNRLRWLL